MIIPQYACSSHVHPVLRPLSIVTVTGTAIYVWPAPSSITASKPSGMTLKFPDYHSALLTASDPGKDFTTIANACDMNEIFLSMFLFIVL